MDSTVAKVLEVHLRKSCVSIMRCGQIPRRHVVPARVGWLLCCLLIVLLCCGFVQPRPLFADGPPVTQEIRYQMPAAGEVFLVWGINGWVTPPEEARPAGTVVKDGVTRTPMARQGDVFVVNVQVAAGTTLDYGFLITKTRRGADVDVWEGDGDQDFHSTVTQDGFIEVWTALTLEQEQPPTSGPASRFPLLVGLGLVLGIGAVIAVRRDALPFGLGAWTRGQQLTYLRDLLRELVIRDIKLSYKGSVLGIVWSLLNPLFHMLVFVFLRRRVLALDIPNYPQFVFIGVLAWNWFQSGVLGATAAITGNRELVRRPGFPVAILPVVTVTTNLFHFVLALPIPLLFLVLGGERPTAALLALPVLIVAQFLLVLSLGYLVATANVTFRDTQHILGIIFRLFFFLTPIFYDVGSVASLKQTFFFFNPMFHLITSYRAILINGEWPAFLPVLAVGALSGVLLWIGHAVFTRASVRFAEEL